jgi:lipopolysaccharide export system protein LptA
MCADGARRALALLAACALLGAGLAWPGQVHAQPAAQAPAAPPAPSPASPPAPGRAQPVLPDFDSQRNLPIDLDAQSSEFDRGSNRLVFHGMHITQGTLSIRADVAEATRLDFENSRWQFRGHVEIINQGAKAWCDTAELTFLGHQLRSALLHGAPARFEQQGLNGQRTEGRAGTMDYDVAGGMMRMSANAWISDGANEIAGERISYDLRRQYVTAEAGSAGPVRMKINPSQRDQKGGAAP